MENTNPHLNYFRCLFLIEREKMQNARRGVGMASMKDAALEVTPLPDSGIRRLNRILRQRNITDDKSPFVSRALERLELVRPKIEEAKAFIAATGKRTDLDERTRKAELAGPQTAVAMFSALVDLYEAASKGSDSVPLKLIAVAANTLGAYLNKGPVLQTNIYAVADPQVSDAQVSARMTTARQLHFDVRTALDGVDEQLGVVLPVAPF